MVFYMFILLENTSFISLNTFVNGCEVTGFSGGCGTVALFHESGLIQNVCVHACTFNAT